MRHDLLGADLQMFHLVEHGIENDMLCTGVDDRLNLFRALGRAAPNTHARTEIGVFVSYVEPLASPFLAARFIIVHCQINPLAIAEGLRVAFSLIEKAANHRRLTDESIGRRRTGAHPAVAVLNRALEGIFVMTAEPERQVWFLDRFWFHSFVLMIPRRPVNTRRRFTPET